MDFSQSIPRACAFILIFTLIQAFKNFTKDMK